MESSAVIPANRVFQLESHNLNNEINKTVDHIVDNLNIPILSEETKLFMKSYIFAGHLQDSTSIGMKAFNLNYYQIDKSNNLMKVNPRSYKLLLLTATNLILPYITKRYNYIENLIFKSPIQKLKFSWITLNNLIVAAKSLSIINFLLFLFDAKQLLPQERLLGLIPALSEQNYFNNMTINKIQMELLNRDTIWRALAEFLTNIIPLVNKDKLKNQILKLICLNDKLTDNLKLSDKILTKESVDKCAICEKQPFNPFIIGCKHVFCYYCLHSRYLIDMTQGYTCSICNYGTKDETQVMRFKYQNLKPL